jgi:streptogramin lyase
VKTMDQGKGDEEDLAARYFEFAQQFLTLSNEETDGMASTEAAAAASVLNIMGVAARAMIGEEDEEMPDAEETPVWGGSSPRKLQTRAGTSVGHTRSSSSNIFQETGKHLQ